MTKLINKHDAVFKDLMSHREQACELMGLYLPDGLVQRINFTSVTLDKLSTEYLRQQSKSSQAAGQGEKDIADLVFKFNFKDGDEGRCIVHVEHQSTVDKKLVLRIMQYQVSTLLDLLKQNPNKKLPLIVTIIYKTSLKTLSISSGM